MLSPRVCSVGVTTLCVVAIARPAASSCKAPEEIETAWSYPAEGDRVPANLRRLFIRGNGGSVLVDGEELEREPSGLRMPALIRDHQYTVSIERVIPGGDSGFETIRRSFEFSTEDPLVGSPPPTPKVLGYSMGSNADASDMGISERCLEILHIGACYDTGEDTLLKVHVEGSAYVWGVKPETWNNLSPVWPADCGGPAMFGHRNDFENWCIRVYAFDQAGRETASESYCISDLPNLSNGTGEVIPDAGVGTNETAEALDASMDVGAAQNGSIGQSGPAAAGEGENVSLDSENDLRSGGCSVLPTGAPQRRWSWLILPALSFMRRRRSG